MTLSCEPWCNTKDVKLDFFHNRSSNRYNRLKTSHRFLLCCGKLSLRLRVGGRSRWILLHETCSISIVVGISSAPLHSVACLCSRGSQVTIEFGLGRRIGGDTGCYKLQWRQSCFSGRHQTCRSAGARAGVRQQVGRGRGRPKAASVLSARWRLGAVITGTFIDISRLQRLRCMLLIIICFLCSLVSRPTARCCKSQFDFRVSVTVDWNRSRVM